MTEPHYDLLVHGARIIDPAQGIDRVGDIAVRGGVIAATGDLGGATADRVLVVDGLIASPGWIDGHVHVFRGGVSGVDADREAGVAAGVTTVVDAGSCGAGTWDGLREYVIERATTRVLGYLNISLMPSRGPRHGDWANFDQRTTIRTAEREAAAGCCVGIKVLASQTHCGNLTIAPVKLARQAARFAGTGLMVHIGNAPPMIEEVLDLLEEGDIVTHCWHGKYGGLLGPDKKPLPQTRAAVARGVKFDIGHGSASFSFETARHALDAGLPVHAISTDIHRGNLKGPVVDQGTTMAKFLHLGFSLPEVIRLSTLGPAQLIRRAGEIGTLRPGACADITLFRVIDGEFALTDSEKRTEQATRNFAVTHTVRGGHVVKEPNHSA